MRKKTNIPQEELDKFYQAIEGVKPLKCDKIRLGSKLPTRKVKSISEPDEKEVFGLSEGDRLPPISGDDYLEHKQDGISNKILRKLSKGQYNVEATLDLHGMSVDKARIAVDTFLQQCLREEIRVVLIIHGKGQYSQVPILKNKLNHWLREIEAVLAFCSAAPSHGNRGATYVLLKRKKEEKFA